MNRAQKEGFVSDLAKNVQESQALAVMSFSKLTVEQMTSFRLNLKKKDIDVKVVKNTLAKRVFNDSPFKELSPFMEGPTLLAFSKKDPIVTAKAIMEWASKEAFNVKLKSGIALGKVVTSTEIESLSKLPGRNELLVGFLWALKSPGTKFLYALQDTPRKLGYALGALEKKKKETGS